MVGEEVMVLPKTEIKEEDVVPQVWNKLYKIIGRTSWGWAAPSSDLLKPATDCC